MNELNKIVLPNGTELTFPTGGGSDVTEATVAAWGFTKNTGNYDKPVGGIPESDLSADVRIKLNDRGSSDVTAETVREWGFAYESEVNDVEAELARFDLFDWSLLANDEFPTGWRPGYYQTDGAPHPGANWSRTRRHLYRRNQYCVLQSDKPIRVHAFDRSPYSYPGQAQLMWYITSTDGTPLRFKTDDVLYIIVSVGQPLDTITTDPPKLYWVFPNTPTVDEITDSTEGGAIPNVGAVKDYVGAHGGGTEVTEQTVSGWGFTKFDGNYNSLSNKPSIPAPVTDQHIIDVITAAYPNAEGVGF